MIYEDNDGLRKGLEELLSLSDEFLITHSVSNALGVEEEVKQNTADIILMDIAMPGMTMGFGILVSCVFFMHPILS